MLYLLSKVLVNEVSRVSLNKKYTGELVFLNIVDADLGVFPLYRNYRALTLRNLKLLVFSACFSVIFMISESIPFPVPS